MRRALLSGVAGISLAVGVGPAFADPPLPNLTNLNFADYTGNKPERLFPPTSIRLGGPAAPD